MRFWLRLQAYTIAGRLRLNRLWPESASRIALRSSPGERPLSREFLNTSLLIQHVCQRGKESHYVINF